MIFLGVAVGGSWLQWCPVSHHQHFGFVFGLLTAVPECLSHGTVAFFCLSTGTVDSNRNLMELDKSDPLETLTRHPQLNPNNGIGLIRVFPLGEVSQFTYFLERQEAYSSEHSLELVTVPLTRCATQRFTSVLQFLRLQGGGHNSTCIRRLLGVLRELGIRRCFEKPWLIVSTKG